MAYRHNIPKGKMHSNFRLKPDHIVCKTTQRNNIRRANTCDPALKLRHTKTLTKPMEGLSRCMLGSQVQHTLFGRPYMVCPTEQHPTLNISITFNNKITTTSKKY